MRRSDREVTDPADIVCIMQRCKVLHLAFHAEPAPYILPVNFGMEADGLTLYIHGAATGEKYDLMDKDHHVGFEMEHTGRLVLEEKGHSCTMDYESIIGWGILEELTEESQKLHALETIMAHYHSEDFPFSRAPVVQTRILCLRVRERTAKRRRKQAAV